MMNKKAQGGAGLTLALVSISIVFILVIFIIVSIFITSGVSLGVKQKSLELSDKNQAQISLQAYLKTKVEINNQSLLMSDLIRIASFDENYKQVLQAKTHSILDLIYENYVLTTPFMEINLGKVNKEIQSIEIYLPAKEPMLITFSIAGVEDND